MTNHRQLSLIFMWCAFVFLIMVSLSSFAAMLMFKNMNTVYAQLLLALPFVIVFEIKRLSRNFFLFLGLSLSLLAISIILALVTVEYFPYRLLIIAYMTIITCVSITTRLSPNHEEITSTFLIMAITINAVLSIAAIQLNIAEIELFFAVISLLQFILYISFTRMSRLDYSLEIIESTSIQPLNKIMSFNNLITALSILTFSVVILALILLRAENMFYSIGRLVLKLIRYLASLTNTGREPAEEIEMQSIPQGGDMDLSMFGEPNEPFILFVILEKLLFFIVYVLLIGGVIFGSGYLFYRLYKRFNDKLPENGDIKEFLLPEILTEKKGGIFENFRNLFNGFLEAGDNNKKVRRIFYKKVSAHISKGVDISKFDTSDDIKEKIKESEDVALLASLYRKARYSNELLSDKEVSVCKK